MSPGFDSYDEMHALHGVDDVAEQLLNGRLPAQGAPATHSGMAALFEALRSPATAAELSAQTSIVAAMVAEVQTTAPSLTGPVTQRRRRVLSKILTAKVAAAATVAAFGLGTAAAAATGSLPGQTSHANSHASHGLAIASSHTAAGTTNGKGHPSGSAGSSSPSGISPTGPANSQAQFGLCQAFLAAQNTSSSNPSTSPPQYNSTAFKALIRQNGGSVSGTTTYCKGVVKPGKPSTSSDTGTSSGQPPLSSGKPTSTPGANHGNPPVNTPNSGGTSTADSASGGASSAGSGNATTHP